MDLKKKKRNKREAWKGRTTPPSSNISQTNIAISTTDATIAMISVADFGSIFRNKCRFFIGIDPFTVARACTSFSRKFFTDLRIEPADKLKAAVCKLC